MWVSAEILRFVLHGLVGLMCSEVMFSCVFGTVCGKCPYYDSTIIRFHIRF